MSPVLEELPLAVGEIVDGRQRIGAVARKGRQVVGAGEDVHRVDLDRAQARRRGADVHLTRARGLLHTEAERGEREAARLGRGKIGLRPQRYASSCLAASVVLDTDDVRTA